MAEKCPKCGADQNGYWDSPCDPREKMWHCGSDSEADGSFYQSDKCRIRQLENAIRAHREQKADDRCIEDDDRLYEALGDGIKCDRRIGPKEEMLANCARFIERRCEGGGWPTYAQLEARVAELTAMLQRIHDSLPASQWQLTLWAEINKLLKGDG